MKMRMRDAHRFSNFRRLSFASLGPAIFITLSFILSQFVKYRCDYAARENFYSHQHFGNMDEAISLGLYCWLGESGTKYDYPEGFHFDSSFTAARGFAIVTTILGAVSWVSMLLTFTGCCKDHDLNLLLIATFTFITFLFECCTFIFFNTDYCDRFGCKIDTASKFGIAACVFWFAGTLSTCAAAKLSEGHDAAVAPHEPAYMPRRKAAEEAKKKNEEKDEISCGGETIPHDHEYDIEKQTTQKT